MKRKITFDVIMEALDGLDKSFLIQVKAKASILLDMKKNNDGHSINPREDLFYSVVVSHVINIVGGECMPYHMFKLSSQYKRFNEGFYVIDRFTKQAIGNSNIVERVCFYNILTDALVSWLEKRDVVFGINPAIRNMSDIARVFDASFPGYLNAGLASNLIQVMGSRREELKVKDTVK